MLTFIHNCHVLSVLFGVVKQYSEIKLKNKLNVFINYIIIINCIFLGVLTITVFML